jgi:hypothetical protein
MLSFVRGVWNSSGDVGPIVPACSSYDRVSGTHFNALLTQLRSLLQNSLVKETGLVPVVSAFRQHILACDETFMADLCEAVDICWPFLRHIKYAGPDGIAPRQTYGIVMVSLTE